MEIVHIATELAPIAKVGGLGDVVHGLSRALVKKGHRVRVVIPKYDTIDYRFVEDLEIAEKNFIVIESGHEIENTIWTGKIHGIEIILIQSAHPKKYFDRGKIYGEKDDNDRFLFFSKAAADFLKKQEKKIDVIHLHDWPVAACSLIFSDPHHPKVVFTIHNLHYQGRCGPFNLQRLGIPYDEIELRDPTYHDAVNLLKGALVYSDLITTVSPSYMKEIQTPEGGCGLDEVLVKYKKKLFGILNGIDTEYWDPATDPFLAKNYDSKDPFLAKKENKKCIQKLLKLAHKDKPLVISVTRLASQKGPDLIQYGIEKTLELGGQFILLGSVTDDEVGVQFKEFKKHHEHNSDISLCLEYDEPLSHILYGASDLFLMPSIFEPCGLTQMIALRYGSVPLVRATGGLKDTVFDPSRSKTPNGYSFEIPDNRAVAQVLEKAFDTYNNHPDEWKQIVHNGMTADLSWDVSADKYIEIYQS